MGNINTDSLKVLWNTAFKKLWTDILEENIPSESICSGCQKYKGFIREADIIDNDVSGILERIRAEHDSVLENTV